MISFAPALQKKIKVWCVFCVKYFYEASEAEAETIRCLCFIKKIYEKFRIGADKYTGNFQFKIFIRSIFW